MVGNMREAVGYKSSAHEINLGDPRKFKFFIVGGCVYKRKSKRSDNDHLTINVTILQLVGEHDIARTRLRAARSYSQPMHDIFIQSEILFDLRMGKDKKIYQMLT